MNALSCREGHQTTMYYYTLTSGRVLHKTEVTDLTAKKVGQDLCGLGHVSPSVEVVIPVLVGLNVERFAVKEIWIKQRSHTVYMH